MAEDKEQGGEKEFDATDAKKRQAREKGDVAQSKEANAFAVTLGAILAVLVFQSFTGPALFGALSALLHHADAFGADGGALGRQLQQLALSVVPLFVLPAAAVGASLAAQRAVAVSGEKIKPDISKLSPVSNLKQRYGAKGITDFLKDAAKMLVACGIGAFYLWSFVNNNHGLSAITAGQIAGFTLRQALGLVACFALFQLFLALIDLPLQQRLQASKLKMTREEVKKELKQSEGDPLLKQSRRQKARDIAGGDVREAVSNATVVMTNPTHYAVALSWDEAGGGAPVCVAKGADHLAARIREVAAEAEVPLYSDPPAARSLFRMVEVGEEIRPEHFAAVAAAIQFIQTLQKTTQGSGHD